MKKYLLFLTASLALTAAHGQITFQKTYGGTGNEEGHSVQQTSDGGFIITGKTQSFGVGSSDVYLAKTASDGSIEWAKTYGGTKEDYGYSVQQTNDGGFIITGETRSFSSGIDYDIYLLKVASDGTLQWDKTFGGTFGNDVGRSVQQTKDGGYIIGGTYSFGAGNYDVYLVKTFSDGTLQWTKTFGGSSDDKGYSVQQTNDDGFIITGYAYLGAGLGQDDVYLLKTTSGGILEWTKTFGGPSLDWGQSVKQTNDGGYIVGGSTQSFGAGNYGDFYLVKTNSGGALQWTKTFGRTNVDEAYSVQQTNDGGFIITGYTIFGVGVDFYLVKTAFDGNLQWAKTFDGGNIDQGYSVFQTNDGGFIITGETKSFGAGNYDIYLIKTDSNGNSGCNEAVPATIVGLGGVQGSSSSLQGTGGLAGTPVTQIGSGGIETVLCFANGINELEEEEYLFTFPNPFSSQTTLRTATPLKSASLTIYNSVGQTVKRIDNLSGATVLFQRDNLPSGLYFVRLTQDGNTIPADKFVIVDE